MILENMLVACVPNAIYAAVVRRRDRLSLSEIAGRLGLGPGKGYLVGLAAAVPAAAFGILSSTWTRGSKGLMIAPFVGATPSLPVLGAALSYSLLATAFPEEFLFRGLIAGAMFRRLSFWTANILQALVFLAPHLLLLFLAPQIWILLPGVFGLGLLLGWLRHRSESIWPCIIVHAASNLAPTIAVLNWSGLHR